MKKDKEKKEEKQQIAERLKEVQIVDELQESYVDYAMSVIVSRAIPDIRDGLKPVQRRILWAMWDMGLKSNSRFMKSARIVGETLGKYHPHGDMAVYDTMVRMAQEFSLRYPLIHGQGNFGSIDSDPAAAQRYTEAKMSKISEELLLDIEKDTVDWEPNYDGTRKEPRYLPARLPELLLNGTMGIAVGMATNIPPHNLGEIIDAIVHLIENPDATVHDLMKHIPGPDFPTGGIIYDTEDLERAYSTGRGSVTIQAATDVEEREKHKTIVINEIPFQVNKAVLIEKIANLVQEKRIEGIKDVRDESGRDGMRIAIDLKQEVAPERIINQLFKNTELQKNFYFNMVALVDGIQPRTVSLKDILSAYIDHRKITIIRRVKYDLKKAEERAHILEGLVIALDDIDKVIATIKKSEDRSHAHKNLVAKFKLTPIQADAILDMKLQSLASLESKKIKNELEEKKKEIKEYKAVLKSEKRIFEIITNELAEIKEKHNDERRTVIINERLKEFKDEDFVLEKETVVFMTSDGYIKRMPPESFKTQGRGGRGLHGFNLKEKDKVSQLFIANTHDSALFFTDSGKVFKTRVYKIPASNRTTKGKLVHTFLGLSDTEKVTSFLTYNEKDEDMRKKFLCFGTEKGVIKKTAVPEFDNVRSTGIIAIKLKEDDTLSWVRVSGGNDSFMFATKKGYAIRFSEKEVRPMGRGASGVEAIKLKKDDKAAGFVVIKKENKDKGEKLLVLTENGYGKQTLVEKYKIQKRGGRGVATVKVTKKTGPLAAARLIDKDTKEVIVFSSKGLIIRTELKDIRTAGRATQGVKIMKLDEDDSVVGVVCL
jgi:DNA gyrase subunit A